jgi:hypothetical protein
MVVEVRDVEPFPCGLVEIDGTLRAGTPQRGKAIISRKSEIVTRHGKSGFGGKD